MAALYTPAANTLFRAALLIGVLVAVGVPGLLLAWVRTPYNEDRLKPIEQPIRFDHRHHVVDDGIDCRYCHYPVERSAWAGVPASSLCMNCHAQIWSSAPILEPLRTSYFENVALRWQQVYRLPDYVYFDHAAHVRRGVGCESCHGRVDQMARVYRVPALEMSWCLGCHRDPDPALRPEARVTDMAWAADPAIGAQIHAQRAIDPPTNCTGCHR